MKKYVVLMLAFSLLFSGCGAPEAPMETTQPHSVQLANPWVSCDTLAEAEAAVGFSLSMLEKIGSFRVETFRVMNGQLLEVGYRDGDFTVTVRKQPGEYQDISGIYGTFEREITYETGEFDITERTFGEGDILSLIDGEGYSWSVYTPDGDPENYQDSFLNVLTDQTWIREANEAFCPTIWENGRTRASEISCFFSCTWASPEEIDLADFLRYCPLGEQLFEENTAEVQAVIAAMGENPFLVTPVWRYPREEVSELLQKYTGITVEDLLSCEGVLYLEEYDAFYNCTSDWGPGRFQCTGGDCSGNPLILWGEGNGGAARTLTLRKEGKDYFLVSYLNSEE